MSSDLTATATRAGSQVSEQHATRSKGEDEEGRPATGVLGAARSDWLAALLLAALTLAVYLPATQFGFIWDDEHYVEFNPTLRTLKGLAAIWTDTSATPQYYPLVHTSFWLEYQLWELDARGYHCVNILLHLAAALLLWRVFRLLEIPSAWLCAAVFALHPVNIESVAWVTERKNVLALCFYAASALAYLKHTLGPEERRPTPLLYPLSLAFFLGALFSKTVACSLPASLLLLLWWKRGRIEGRWLLELTPFFVLGLVLGLQTAYLEKVQVGASGAAWDLSFVDRCLIAGRALWFYATSLLWPNPSQMAFFYPRWEIDSGQLWQYGFPLAALAVAGAAWLGRARWGLGPFVALLIYAGTLLPALGFIDVYPMRFSYVADHFQYLAAPAFIALVVGGAAHELRGLGPWALRLAPLAGAVVLALLASLSWQQLPQFRDLDHLWRATLEKNPGSWAAAHNLAMDLAEAEKPDEAMQWFRHALTLREDYEQASNGLAIALSGQGRSREAILQHRQTLAMNPDNSTALNNLARILTSDDDPTLRNLAEAQRMAEHARELSKGTDPRVLIVLAEVYFEQGRLGDAIATLIRANSLAKRQLATELTLEARKRLEFYRLVQASERKD